MKHVVIDYIFLCDKVQTGVLHVAHVFSVDQLLTFLLSLSLVLNFSIYAARLASLPVAYLEGAYQNENQHYHNEDQSFIFKLPCIQQQIQSSLRQGVFLLSFLV